MSVQVLTFDMGIRFTLLLAAQSVVQGRSAEQEWQ